LTQRIVLGNEMETKLILREIETKHLNTNTLPEALDLPPTYGRKHYFLKLRDENSIRYGKIYRNISSPREIILDIGLNIMGNERFMSRVGRLWEIVNYDEIINRLLEEDTPIVKNPLDRFKLNEEKE